MFIMNDANNFPNYNPQILKTEGNVVYVDFNLSHAVEINYQCPHCSNIFSQYVKLNSLAAKVICEKCSTEF